MFFRARALGGPRSDAFRRLLTSSLPPALETARSARLGRASLSKAPTTSLEVERHVRREAVTLDVLHDRRPVLANAREVFLEVVHEHPRDVGDLCVIHRGSGERFDHERGVAYMELDPWKAVRVVGERILSLRQGVRRLEAERVGEPASRCGRPEG